MRFIIAPDSFKGSLSAGTAAAAMAAGARRVFPAAECFEIPIADGGEGTVDSLLRICKGRRISRQVRGPRGRQIMAGYALLDHGETAVIETSAASGLHLLTRRMQDPMRTSSYGTGELIRDALERGAKRIIVGTGGSATVDGGTGMAQALGIRFRDRHGRLLRNRATGGMLERIVTIDLDQRHEGLAAVEWIAAVDVSNRLCGVSGAARVYGPQKGATTAMVRALDQGLRHLGRIIYKQLGIPVLDLVGGGSAGGLAAGLAAFTGARLVNGFELIAGMTGLEARMRGADLVLTGEGRLDAQTFFGKAPAGVARIAAALGIPVIAIAGSLGEGYQSAYAHGFAGISSVISSPVSPDEALVDSTAKLAEATERTLRLFRAGMRLRAGGCQ